MQGSHVYINAFGKFLPNDPVDNEAMESLLGLVAGRPSRAKRITLRNNRITRRHYAIDPATRALTHNNAALTAAAVRDALARADWKLGQLDLLACGTSSPDQLKPAHANMVHGALGERSMEVVTTAGVCSSGMAALKYAYLSVKSGEARHAVSTGSELASSFMLARNFGPESDGAVAAAEAHPGLAFEMDFLRWMLSDGAGAAALSREPNADRLALRIDWIEALSLAHELPVCMYSGAIKQPDGGLRGWREAASPEEIGRNYYFAVKQDARLLDDLITRLVARDTTGAILARRGLRAADVDWFLPHYSSEYFRPKLAAALAAIDCAIDASRWFTNLARVGNVGSASIYLMLEELAGSDRLERGQRVLALVPESARFSLYAMALTVV